MLGLVALWWQSKGLISSLKDLKQQIAEILNLDNKGRIIEGSKVFILKPYLRT